MVTKARQMKTMAKLLAEIKKKINIVVGKKKKPEVEGMLARRILQLSVEASMKEYEIWVFLCYIPAG